MSDAVVKTVVKKNNWWQSEGVKSEKPKVEYFPAPGLHFFEYKGRRMWATQWKGETKTIGWESKP